MDFFDNLLQVIFSGHPCNPPLKLFNPLGSPILQAIKQIVGPNSKVAVINDDLLEPIIVHGTNSSITYYGSVKSLEKVRKETDTKVSEIEAGEKGLRKSSSSKMSDSGISIQSTSDSAISSKTRNDCLNFSNKKTDEDSSLANSSLEDAFPNHSFFDQSVSPEEILHFAQVKEVPQSSPIKYPAQSSI